MNYLPPIQIIKTFNNSDYNYQNSYITYYTASLLFSKSATSNIFNSQATFNYGFVCGSFQVDYLGNLTTTGSINISQGITLGGINNNPIVTQNNLYSLVNVTSDIQSQFNTKVNSYNSVLNGIPTTTEPLINDNSNQIATTNYVNLKLNDTNNNLVNYAPLNSPIFQGIATVPTPEQDNTNLTQITNKSFVQSSIANLLSTSAELLNALIQLKNALGNDDNFSTTILNLISLKADSNNSLLTGLSTLNNFYSSDGSINNNMNISNNLAIANNINISGNINNLGNSKINNIKSKTIEVETINVLSELKYKNQVGVYLNIKNMSIPIIKSVYDTTNLHSSNVTIRSQMNGKTLCILPNYTISFFSGNILLQTINNNTTDILWSTIVYSNNVDYCTRILIYYKNIVL